jgi:hypothetical protein
VSPKIALASVLAAAALATPAAAAPQKCNGSAALCAKTFDQVVLAGTHNSMSAATEKFLVPNQQVGIPAQLKLGIRGFLIDTYMAHKQPDGSVVQDDTPTAASRMYLCHIGCGPAGATLFSKTLKQYADFLQHHPNEVLMFVNEDHTAPALFIKAVNASPLKRYLYRGATGPWPTLRTMIKKHQQVVITAENNSAGAPWYHNAYSGIVQETPYSWPQESSLTDPLQQPASCVPNRGGTTGSLFLMNHWSPPYGANPEAGARVNAKEAILSRARMCASLRGKVPTLIAVDMVGSGDVIGAVRELNANPPPTTPVR